MQSPMPSIKIFDYHEAGDFFVETEEYRRLAEELGLTEWSGVVWIGRLFILDNDFGEHWLGNWEARNYEWTWEQVREAERDTDDDYEE